MNRTEYQHNYHASLKKNFKQICLWIPLDMIENIESILESRKQTRQDFIVELLHIQIEKFKQKRK